jgi:gluconolactonase
MPVTIGVFLQAGKIIIKDSTAVRFNRSNEFDNLTDRFARFIDEEIIPEVEKQKSTNGRPIHISRNANDRALGGASSGAICAFFRQHGKDQICLAVYLVLLAPTWVCVVAINTLL